MQTEDCKLSVSNSLNHIEKLEELSDESYKFRMKNEKRYIIFRSPLLRKKKN